ncbi:MAG: hypothetical protein U0176_09990 [Bacteroidia bacterium]
MANSEGYDFGQKLRKGLDLYWKRLVEQHAKDDETLIFSVDKKIVYVRARDFLKTEG